MAERHLEGAAPQRQAPSAGARGRCRTSAPCRAAPSPRPPRTPVADGSPGPVREEHPVEASRGDRRRRCAGREDGGLDAAGRQPAQDRRVSDRSRRRRRGTRAPRSALAGPDELAASYDDAALTPAARSAPAMPGAARTRSASEAGSRSTVDRPARIAPRSRSARVSRRVSMPSMPTTPAAASEAVRVSSARHDDARREASRTAKPATWIAPDSGSSRVHPVVPLVRRRHHDDLPRVRRVGQHLLVAGHARVEDRLAERLALGAERRATEGAAVLEHEQGVGAACRAAGR